MRTNLTLTEVLGTSLRPDLLERHADSYERLSAAQRRTITAQMRRASGNAHLIEQVLLAMDIVIEADHASSTETKFGVHFTESRHLAIVIDPNDKFVVDVKGGACSCGLWHDMDKPINGACAHVVAVWLVEAERLARRPQGRPGGRPGQRRSREAIPANGTTGTDRTGQPLPWTTKDPTNIADRRPGRRGNPNRMM